MNPDRPSLLESVVGPDAQTRRLLDEAMAWERAAASYETSIEAIADGFAVDVGIAALDRYVEHLNDVLRPARQAAVEAQEQILKAFAPALEAVQRVSRSISEQINADRDGWERQLRRARFEIALDRRRRTRAHLVRLRCNLRRLPDTVPVEVVEALAAMVADASVLFTTSARPSPAASTLTVHVPKRRPLTRNLCPHAPPVAACSVHETTSARYSTSRPPGT